MADTIVSVWNQALGACEVRASIASENENSSEGRLCRLWYETILKQVLRAAPWPAASSYKRLALFADASEEESWAPGNPAPGYGYGFSLPSDMIHPRNLFSFANFEISSVNGKKKLSTNEETPILNYTKYLTDITEWDDSFRLAIVNALAAAICGKLTTSRSKSRDLEGKANELILVARTQAANVDQESYEAIPEWFAARGFTGTSPIRFIYPSGSLLVNVGGINGN